MMAARNTLLLIGLSALLAGCFDRDKPSGKLKYDDSAQGANNGSFDSSITGADGSYESALPIDSTPVALKTEVDENWPPPKFQTVAASIYKLRKDHIGGILRVAEIHGVEPELIHAIVSKESAYRYWVVSEAKAVGLMQLIPESGAKYGCTSLKNAACNLDAGTRYLKFLAGKFNGNIRTIAAGYNAGEGVAYSYLHGIPDRELKLTKKNPTGIKTPNGVPLGSFSYTLAQKARCPKNNWQPTETCEGETYHYVRLVLGYYLTYKQHPELIGKTAAPAPSAVAHRQGRI